MHIHKYCHLLLKPPASLRALVWLLLCEQPGSLDTAVRAGSPEPCGAALLAAFNLTSNESRDLTEPSSDLSGVQISSAVLPSGCGTVLKLRAALICFTVCTVEAVLGLLGNYEHVPHSSKVDISFPGVVVFVFM